MYNTRPPSRAVEILIAVLIGTLITFFAKALEHYFLIGISDGAKILGSSAGAAKFLWNKL